MQPSLSMLELALPREERPDFWELWETCSEDRAGFFGLIKSRALIEYKGGPTISK